MAKLSGTDLAGFEAQLKTTKMFYTPEGRASASRLAPDLPKTMDLVRTFCFEHNLLGEKREVEGRGRHRIPERQTLGSTANVKLRFDPTYMKMAADGKL